MSKRRTKNRRDTLKDAKRSISQIRNEHKRNMDHINAINESVQYSPRRTQPMQQALRVNLNQRSYDSDACNDRQLSNMIGKRQMSVVESAELAEDSQAMTHVRIRENSAKIKPFARHTTTAALMTHERSSHI